LQEEAVQEVLSKDTEEGDLLSMDDLLMDVQMRDHHSMAEEVLSEPGLREGLAMSEDHFLEKERHQEAQVEGKTLMNDQRGLATILATGSSGWTRCEISQSRSSSQRHETRSTVRSRFDFTETNETDHQLTINDSEIPGSTMSNKLD
jgi:hypothetical protein